MPLDQRRLGTAHCPHELEDDLVLDVSADRDDVVESLREYFGLHASDVWRWFDRREVVLLAHCFELGLLILAESEVAHTTDTRGDFGDLGRPDGEEEHIDLARFEIVGGANHVHRRHLHDIVVRKPAGRQHGNRMWQVAGLLHPSRGHALALEVRDRLVWRVLAHERTNLEWRQGHRQTQIGLGFAIPVAHALASIRGLTDIEDEEIGLLRVHRIEHRRITAVADHPHLQLGVVLDRLGHHRRLRMQNRARWQRGEADGGLRMRGAGHADPEQRDGRDRSRSRTVLEHRTISSIGESSPDAGRMCGPCARINRRHAA